MENKKEDINLIAKLMPALIMTKQGANLESISLEGAEIALTFTGGEIWTVKTKKPLHGLKLIKKIVKALQGQVEIY